MPPIRIRGALAAALLGTALVAPAAGAQSAQSTQTALRDVLLVGNSQSGTVGFVDGRTFASLGAFNVIPDLQDRLNGMNPIERAGYEIVKATEGGDRFVDDASLSPDGRVLYVSRGNLDDVAAFDLGSGTELWHTRLEGFHADHAALSPDGSRFVVSATTAGKAQVLDTASGQITGSFTTGTYPHQNDYSADGRYIYNSSIGTVSLPKWMEWAKGDFLLTKVDATTLQVVQTWRFPHGIRPNVLAADGHTLYAQQSYLNGFIKYDLTTSSILNTVTMPFSAAGAALKVDDYPKNSAHHGLALSGDGAKICDVGTIDDYAAIVSTADLSTAGTVTYAVGSLPYWGQTSVDGRYCFVSLSKLNAVSVVDYTTAREVARVPVGTFPQRERIGKVDPAVLGSLH